MVNNLCVFLSALRSFFVSVVSFMLPGAVSAADGLPAVHAVLRGACGFMSFTFAKIHFLISDVKFYHDRLYAKLLLVCFHDQFLCFVSC